MSSPGSRICMRARFEAGQGCAIRICQAFAEQIVFGGDAGDETGEHRGSLFAHQFGIVILVQLVKLDQRPGEPGFAPDLSRPQGTEQMDDLGGSDAHDLQAAGTGHRRQAAVVRVAFVEMVGHAPTEAVELDAGTDRVAVRPGPD